ncbi:nucleoside permease [Chondrinema litorale]|uniref:nucleoside permease n=1 Tax=Chondrinema litorale TaxID=2994555 RepID=UPI0025434218|nr:nucleoside permease [Chondrinema litorale]UZR94506.1 nucleoside permease [Chondrinema litorale]
MKQSLRIQLSLMMFLEYFVWGAWYVTMGTYLTQTLQFSASEIGIAFAAVSVAAMVSPIFVGMVADRFFPTEKILAVLHLFGAVVFVLIGNATEFSWFYLFFQIYTLCFMPTIALTNSISFRHLNDPDKQFPGIRVFGTIGFIAAGLVISFAGYEDKATMFYVSAVCSVLLGVYSFFLPHTPPKDKGKEVTVSDILGLKALSMLKDRSFLIFFIASVLICVPLSFYYAWANPFLNELGMENAAAKMTFGQVSETLFLIIMPLFFKRLGVKWMLVVAMIAWVARYVLFAFGDLGPMTWMLFGGIVLHGICYDFFFVTGQIYVDNKAGDKIKSAAQGLITFATYGIGMFIGSFISGQVVEAYTIPEGHIWETIWLIPASLAAVVLVVFLIFFSEKKSVNKPEEVSI